MKSYRQLIIDYVLVLPKTDQQKVAIALMHQTNGPGKIDCKYLSGYELCSCKYLYEDIEYSFVSKAGQLDCINLMYGGYTLGHDSYRYALVGKRVQNQNTFKFMEEFE